MSKAAASLSALINMGQDIAQAEDASIALDRVTVEREAVTQVGDDGEAEFGTPEAIATAVLGSLILGPVGGILLGGAQGWLKKRSDQALLDNIASEQNILTAASDVYTEQLTAFKDSAINENDLEQIGVMESGLTAAKQFMLSPDSDMRAQGVALMAGVDQEMNAYASRQETQRIAADANTAQLKVELGERQFDRYTGLQADFDAQSQGYLDREQAGLTAIRALENGTPADLHAAIILFNKTLDPNSAVLGEERQAITEMGGILDKAYNFLAGGMDGKQMNTEQRRELSDAIVLISKTSTEFQMQREAMFSDRVSDADLPTKFHDNFRLVQGVPAAETPFIPPDLLEQALIQDRIARDNQSMFIGDTVDSIKQGAQTVGEGVDNFIDKATEFGSDLERNAGELLQRANAGADRVEQLFQRGLRTITGRPTN